MRVAASCSKGCVGRRREGADTRQELCAGYVWFDAAVKVQSGVHLEDSVAGPWSMVICLFTVAVNESEMLHTMSESGFSIDGSSTCNPRRKLGGFHTMTHPANYSTHL